MDIFGKIPKSVGGHEYLFIAIDKFAMWVEVMPIPRQTAQAAIKIIEGIVYWFKVPNRIITDNGTQFTSKAFLNFCEEMGIKVCFTSVSYPRSNRQVEQANAEVLKGLKTKAFDKLENKEKSGLITCQVYYGHSEQHQVESLERHPSSSSTGRKMSYRQNSSTDHPGCSHMMRTCKKRGGSMT